MNGSGYQRYCNIALVLGIASFALAAFGHWQHWPEGRVGSFLGMGVGLVAMRIVMSFTPKWWRENIAEEFDSAVSRRYRKRMLPAMLIYVVLIFVCMPLLKQNAVTSVPLRALIAILPTLPIAYVFRAFLQYVREVDEFKRRIELEAVGIAAMIVCLVYFPLSFLQLAKVIDVPSSAAMLYVFPLMCAGYGIGKFITSRRYR